MKIGLFSCSASFDMAKPLIFELLMPDNGHIVDANIVFGHKVVQLHMNVVHDVNDKLAPMTMIGLRVGQEHVDVREYEFVQKVRTRKSTSDIESYYLFVAPRSE